MSASGCEVGIGLAHALWREAEYSASGVGGRVVGRGIPVKGSRLGDWPGGPPRKGSSSFEPLPSLVGVGLGWPPRWRVAGCLAVKTDVLTKVPVNRWVRAWQSW